jgi:hypothetical protein
MDDERVLARLVRRGRGKTSGLDLAHIHLEGAHLFEVRDGRTRKLVVCWGARRAFADLGLTPDGDAR